MKTSTLVEIDRPSQLKIENKTFEDFISDFSLFNITKKSPTNLILNELKRSNKRYYYATFNKEDFLNNLSELNPGYKLNLMNFYYVPIDKIILYIAVY